MSVWNWMFADNQSLNSNHVHGVLVIWFISEVLLIFWFLLVNHRVHYIRLRLGLVTTTGTCVINISMAAFPNVLCGMIVSILAAEKWPLFGFACGVWSVSSWSESLTGVRVPSGRPTQWLVLSSQKAPQTVDSNKVYVSSHLSGVFSWSFCSY